MATLKIGRKIPHKNQDGFYTKRHKYPRLDYFTFREYKRLDLALELQMKKG